MGLAKVANVVGAMETRKGFEGRRQEWAWMKKALGARLADD